MTDTSAIRTGIDRLVSATATTRAKDENDEER
jgi:hypothetical protein